MKSLLNKILAATLLVVVAACGDEALRKSDVELNKDVIEDMNDPYLLSSIIKKTAIFYQDRGWGDTRLPGAVQYTMRNYQGGDNNYNGFKAPADDMYKALEVLKFIDVAITKSEARDSKIHVGVFQTFRVLLFSFITDFYGDVYYSQALRGREGVLYPVYDRQQEIYTGMLKSLDDAYAMIEAGHEPVSQMYDLMFGGDKAQWLKFNNSIKLRLLMHAAAKLPDVNTRLAAVMAKPLLSEEDDMNASIAYVGTTSQTPNNSGNSWIGGSNNWGTGGEFEKRRPCKTLVDIMTSMNDPRVPVWFAPVEEPWTNDPGLDGETFETIDPNGFTYTSTWEYLDTGEPVIAAQQENITDVDDVYVGFIAGMGGDFKNGNGHYNTSDGGAYGNFKVSMYSQLFRENAHELLRAQVMNKDEVQFHVAEAIAQGWISGDADEHYRAGIRLSMQRWGVSDADIAAYLAQSSVDLPADKEGKLDRIATEKWIALFSVATESYLELRRTHLPDILDNGDLRAEDFPSRYRYPGAELGQNKKAYDAGVATLSPAVDTEFSKIWLLQ